MAEWDIRAWSRCVGAFIQRQDSHWQNPLDASSCGPTFDAQHGIPNRNVANENCNVAGQVCIFHSRKATNHDAKSGTCGCYCSTWVQGGYPGLNLINGYTSRNHESTVRTFCVMRTFLLFNYRTFCDEFILPSIQSLLLFVFLKV